MLSLGLEPHVQKRAFFRGLVAETQKAVERLLSPNASGGDIMLDCEIGTDLGTEVDSRESGDKAAKMDAHVLMPKAGFRSKSSVPEMGVMRTEMWEEAGRTERNSLTEQQVRTNSFYRTLRDENNHELEMEQRMMGCGVADSRVCHHQH